MDNLDLHIYGLERLLRSVEGRSEMTIKSYCTKVEEFFKWLMDKKCEECDFTVHETDDMKMRFK